VAETVQGNFYEADQTDSATSIIDDQLLNIGLKHCEVNMFAE
jgi:hypothetical protein